MVAGPQVVVKPQSRFLGKTHLERVRSRSFLSLAKTEL